MIQSIFNFDNINFNGGNISCDGGSILLLSFLKKYNCFLFALWTI